MINESLDTAHAVRAVENLKSQLQEHGYGEPVVRGSLEMYKHPTKPSISIAHNGKTVIVAGEHTQSAHSFHSPEMNNLVHNAIQADQHAKEIHNVTTETDPKNLHDIAINSDHNIRAANDLIHVLRKSESAQRTDEGQENLKRFTQVRDHNKSILDLATDNKHTPAAALDIAAKHGFMITHRRQATPEAIHKQVAANLDHNEYSLHAAAALTNSNTSPETLNLIGKHPSFRTKVQAHPNYRG